MRGQTSFLAKGAYNEDWAGGRQAGEGEVSTRVPRSARSRETWAKGKTSKRVSDCTGSGFLFGNFKMQWKAYCVQSTLGLSAQFCNLGITIDISPCLFTPKWRDSRKGKPQPLGPVVVSWASEMFPWMTVRMQGPCIRSSSDRTQSLNSTVWLYAQTHTLW